MMKRYFLSHSYWLNISMKLNPTITLLPVFSQPIPSYYLALRLSTRVHSDLRIVSNNNKKYHRYSLNLLHSVLSEKRWEFNDVISKRIFHWYFFRFLTRMYFSCTSRFSSWFNILRNNSVLSLFQKIFPYCSCF